MTINLRLKKNNGAKADNTDVNRKRSMDTASNNTWESKPLKQREVPKIPPKFAVTYSRLCDGGAQEMTTAVCTVREIFGDAVIRTHRRTREEDLGLLNPEVVISTPSLVNNTAAEVVLWSNKQRNLYQKYPKKRKRSMKEIKKAMEKFKNAYAKQQQQQQQQGPMLEVETPAMDTGSIVESAVATVATTAMATTSRRLPEVSEDFTIPDITHEGLLGDVCELDADIDVDSNCGCPLH